jgi:hypothetical protein
VVIVRSLCLVVESAWEESFVTLMKRGYSFYGGYFRPEAQVSPPVSLLNLRLFLNINAGDKVIIRTENTLKVYWL